MINQFTTRGSREMHYLGKTVFLFYLLFIRILRKERTLFRNADNRFVGFSDDGVCLHSPDSPTFDVNWDYPLGTWALADSSFSRSDLGAPERNCKLIGKLPFFRCIAS
jgi:hypothetical protein